MGAELAGLLGVVSHVMKDYGPWCIGWLAWLYERRQTRLAHQQLSAITNIFLKMLSHDRAAIAMLESLTQRSDGSRMFSQGDN